MRCGENHHKGFYCCGKCTSQFWTGDSLHLHWCFQFTLPQWQQLIFFFLFSGADVAKTSQCQSCRVWFLTDYFDNHKFGRNIATGKSCRTFLATTSKLLPPVFYFSSSHVKLKMDHKLFLLHMRCSRESQALTIIK